MTKRRFIFSIVLLMILLIPAEIIMGQYSIPPKLEWWYEARFGMFIHFGSYSYLGHGEWAFSVEGWTKANYQAQVSANFNPTNFNAGTIAGLLKKAGMKYLVITAKHHEGFCIWPTAVQSFKDVTGTKLYDLPAYTAFKSRDILQELKDSCEVRGIKFGLYYSILDWNHSSQEINRTTYYSDMISDSARTSYINDMKEQLSELITKYHPAVLWFDGDWTYNSGSPTLSSWWTKADGIELYNYLQDLDAELIVNERICRSFGLGDFDCPEQQVPAAPLSRQWETCQTMNNSWGYNASDLSYKTPKTLIQQLVTVVSRDGNYLLNIGPKGDGTVPNQSVDILNSFGDWMNIYSESIYGTTRSPYPTEPRWGVYTKKSGKLYVHVFSWPAHGQLLMPALTNTKNKIYLLNDTTTTLSYTDSNGCISIAVPAIVPDLINSVIVIAVSGVPAASTEHIKVNDITVSSSSGTTVMAVGDTLPMLATVTPVNAAIQSVTWSVSDTTRASISAAGTVTAKKSGTVYAQATANDGTDIQGKLRISISAQTGMKEQSGHSIPATAVLEQNYPNPFNPATTIRFSIPNTSYVSLLIYNISGEEIATLISTRLDPGSYTQDWNASSLPSGIYFYRLLVKDLYQTRKLILLR
jgi:alpha-L-fucosidase